MTLDPRKRQRKLERKKAKEKARHKALAVREVKLLAHRFARAGEGPVIDSFLPSLLWEQGIGNVVLARDVGGGDVAFASFLLDIYCLGVKDVFFEIVSREEYLRIREQMVRKIDIEKRSPESIRKLVEEGVEYARSLGFEPHGDYDRAKTVFGDLDASLCREKFTFGREGKPFFISGPHDSPAKCSKIVRTLAERCGVGAFDYLVRLSPSQMMSAGLASLLPPSEQ
ncbi:MAG TPA: hypothetical protein VGN42_13540 [Pirellulales bacterium]|nr:hypothetical protein [Pirellulales bacterium]